MHNIIIDPEVMSDEELGACTNELVKRSIQVMRNSGYTAQFGVMVIAASYGAEGDYEIKHQARFGSEYGAAITRETNNLMLSATRAATAWLEDQETKPENVRKLIQAPEQPSSNDDDIPF
jgi:hypothetical protein